MTSLRARDARDIKRGRLLNHWYAYLQKKISFFVA